MFKLLIVLAIGLVPFATSFHLNSNNNNNYNQSLHLDETPNTNENISISLSQFDIFKKIGSGAFGVVHVARKNVGPDNGQIYALKAIPIMNALEIEKNFKRNVINFERDTLEAARDWPFSIGLFYAWRQGKILFLVTDYAPGGDLLSKLLRNRPDANTAKLIFAEGVTIIERLHANGILHCDLMPNNFLIQNDGHLTVADFGAAKFIVHNNETTKDWQFLAGFMSLIFKYPLTNRHEISLNRLFCRMTDENLPELKAHPYFDGIDWEKVAARESDPPFEPIELYLNEDNRIDFVEKLQSSLNAEIDGAIVERFLNYTFVAPEYQQQTNMIY